jgi:hypothetical protein
MRTVWMRCCGSPFRLVTLRAVGPAETPGTTGHPGLTVRDRLPEADDSITAKPGMRRTHWTARPHGVTSDGDPVVSVADWLLDRQFEPYALSLGQITHTPGV